MTLEIQYQHLSGQLSGLFHQLSIVIEEIKAEFKSGKTVDPELTELIIESRLKMVRDYEQRFLKYASKPIQEWSLDKRIKYAIGYMDLFFRIFDNPFISVSHYYKIIELIESLSDETNKLEKLLIDLFVAINLILCWYREG